MDQITSAATERDTTSECPALSTTSITLDHSQRRLIKLERKAYARVPTEWNAPAAEWSSPGLSTLGRGPSRAQNFSLCFEFTVQECVDVLTKQLEAAAPQNHHNDDDDDATGTALLFWDTC